MKLRITFLMAIFAAACSQLPTRESSIPGAALTSARRVHPMATATAWAQGSSPAVTPAPGDGQCGSVSTTASSVNFSFSESGDPSPSPCYRSQENPTDGSNGYFPLAEGGFYTWTWHMEDAHNTGDPGMGYDQEANSLVWQLHPLDFGNVCTYFGFNNKSNGTEQMVLYDCTSSGDLNQVWTGTYTHGQSDNWRIDAQICSRQDESVGHCFGEITLYRNGSQVANDLDPNWDDGATGVNPHKVWWNFGPYKFFWQYGDCDQQNPPDPCDNTSMESASQYISNMTLYSW